MPFYIFECPCCKERHLLNLSVLLEPNDKISPKDQVTWDRMIDNTQVKINESETYKKWREAMA